MSSFVADERNTELIDNQVCQLEISRGKKIWWDYLIDLKSRMVRGIEYSLLESFIKHRSLDLNREWKSLEFFLLDVCKLWTNL